MGTKKSKNPPSPPPPASPKRKEPSPLELSHWLHEISIPQNNLSQFSTWTINPIINWGTYRQGLYKKYTHR
jgi:hypothetical protein